MPFERVRHLVTVPVIVNGSIRTRFVIDTGIGPNLISTAIAERAGTAPTSETTTGRRMSGQVISSAIEILPSLKLGDVVWGDLKVARFDLGHFDQSLRDLGGFLGLGPFERLPFTLDYERGALGLHTSGALGSAGDPGYEEVALYRRREGLGMSTFVDLSLPSGNTARVEVDTGSDSLVLDERFLEDLDVHPGTPSVRTVDGEDETGYHYTRHFAEVAGTFRLRGTAAIGQSNPAVMFQRIIHDGLLGDAFLRHYRVTFDLGRSRIGFTPRGGTGSRHGSRRGI